MEKSNGVFWNIPSCLWCSPVGNRETRKLRRLLWSPGSVEQRSHPDSPAFPSCIMTQHSWVILKTQDFKGPRTTSSSRSHLVLLANHCPHHWLLSQTLYTQILQHRHLSPRLLPHDLCGHSHHSPWGNGSRGTHKGILHSSLTSEPGGRGTPMDPASTPKGTRSLLIQEPALC